MTSSDALCKIWTEHVQLVRPCRSTQRGFLYRHLQGLSWTQFLRFPTVITIMLWLWAVCYVHSQYVLTHSLPSGHHTVCTANHFPFACLDLRDLLLEFQLEYGSQKAHFLVSLIIIMPVALLLKECLPGRKTSTAVKGLISCTHPIPALISPRCEQT